MIKNFIVVIFIIAVSLSLHSCDVILGTATSLDGISPCSNPMSINRVPPDTTFNETDSLSYDILGESKALFKIKYPEERIRYDLVARNKQDSSVIDIKVFNNSNYGTINDSLIVRLYALKAGSASVFLKAEHWDPMDCPNPSISIDMEVVK